MFFSSAVEKLTAIFDAQGHQKSSSIVGAIQVGRALRRWLAGRCCSGGGQQQRQQGCTSGCNTLELIRSQSWQGIRSCQEVL